MGFHVAAYAAGDFFKKRKKKKLNLSDAVMVWVELYVCMQCVSHMLCAMLFSCIFVLFLHLVS